MNKTPINRVWPYCTEFEFFKFKKVLKAKNGLSLRMVTQALTPWVYPGRLIKFNYTKRNRPESFKYGDIISYWDTKKISVAVYLRKDSHGVEMLNKKSYIESIKPVYLLARVPNLRLPWYRRLLVWAKGPSGLGSDPLLPRAPEDNSQKNNVS